MGSSRAKTDCLLLLYESVTVLVVLDRAFGSRDDRDVVLDGELTGLDLVAEAVDHLGLGADEDEASLFNFGSKLSVLRQEPIPGVNPGKPTTPS